MSFYRKRSGSLVHVAKDGTATVIADHDECDYLMNLHASERQHPVPPRPLQSVGETTTVMQDKPAKKPAKVKPAQSAKPKRK